MRPTFMDEQDYFDKTLAHIRSQAEPANRDDGSCLYLTTDGRKCAIGYWIPDGHEAQWHEGGLLGLAADWPDLSGIAWPVGWEVETVQVEGRLDAPAELLQALHDGHHPTTSDNFERYAEIVAYLLELDYNAPAVAS